MDPSPPHCRAGECGSGNIGRSNIRKVKFVIMLCGRHCRRLNMNEILPACAECAGRVSTCEQLRLGGLQKEK